ncbi:SDR family NAD(P)-dependent oxidoreductase [Bradyrhizobium tropiciagri]|uniref:SDR family NAD(P)-dependent oxidoreductase n=1 Tax=Bradyrhizobium tropiciagri TaxID=312253 RepID=UPI001BA8A6C0|nr:SDR family NAD(P)-dependent oxidoreductase [Bradyrhizobium tropiciagri]MBR0898904.1 SDR family NAD(P)-dependent oxidoreductase [Bradyrhizobium tropiciagri]
MKNLVGKVAFVTGAANGIGFALARRFASEGMNVALADVNTEDLSQACSSLEGHGAAVIGVPCDVTSEGSVRKAVDETIDRFGHIHVLCNNAGVSRAGLVEEIPYADWEWVLGVNLMGTIHGLRCALPHMKAHRQGGHIVNTASMAGLIGSAYSGPYCASKFAVVGLSEVLKEELEAAEIGVTVVCPSWVRTKILTAGRNRPERFGGPLSPNAVGRGSRVVNEVENGLDPGQIADLVLDAINRNQLYVLTHANRVEDFRQRVSSILQCT